MSASKPQESVEVRIEPSLNEKEKEFVGKRGKAVLQSLQKLQIHCSQNEVPNIALLGSGGGQRAMVGLLGSLVQLQKTGLLDCVLYLSGVSGSTWCMASLYQEPDWSTKLETVKDKIIQRLNGPGVSWTDALDKLKKYYYEKDHFSLTDVWATIFVTGFVKEIDEQKLTDQWNHQSKDPFPIYTVVDKHCKQHKDGDPWFEITPHEAGYSLTGAFVKTSSFGSQFDNGSKIKHQPEIDMLYLQALCGSAIADGDEDKKEFLEKIKEIFNKTETVMFAKMRKEDPKSPPIHKCYQVLMDLVDMNLSVLKGEDPSDLDESIRTKLSKLNGKRQLIFQTKKLNLTADQYMKQYTVDVCNYLHHFLRPLQDESRLNCLYNALICIIYLIFDFQAILMHKPKCALRFHKVSNKKTFYQTDATEESLDIQYKTISKPFTELELLCICFTVILMRILKCIAKWKWGRKYDFLHNMKDKSVPSTLLKTETRDFEDAGLLLNSPYFSVLRKERNIDLIISLDFSEGDPFTTVKKAAEMSKELKIPFPEVNIPSEDSEKPKDFYVFKGKNTPTVIHIPLFNVVNCGDDIETWRNKYKTFKFPYSGEKITDLMEVAGKNITNNKDKLLEQIRLTTGPKIH
ncbi:cytosolic phospholipase A2 gamma-like [Megalobrama amblycephala]|uniref:cytosolic phospholipase A2 gamma-like n=1 Tax=Megalobrama amblycephala TaxID=75352 RepID=UPI0020147A0E|nr:cytosolic phospholipase A2 gamma-like [Megalobrama amblycephala]